MTSILKETREKKGYTVEEVSEILKIRKQYIISLEEENYDNIPGEIYVKGYSKIYHEFLGLEIPNHSSSSENNVISNGEVDVKSDNSVKKHIVAFICMLLLIGIIFLYFNLDDQDYSTGSNLRNSSIIYDDEDNETTFNQAY